MTLSIHSETFLIQEESALTASQYSCSQMIQNFIQEACNPLTLCSLVVGGALARTVELACFRSLTSLTSFSTSRFSRLIPHLSSLAGIITEGGCFAGIPMIQEGGSLSTLAIGTGHGSLVIGLSRVIGRYTHFNLTINCLAQDCVVIGVDMTFEALQLRETQNIRFVERWAHARAIAFQMHISGQIAHSIPGVSANQAGFNLKKEFYKSSLSSHSSLFPNLAFFSPIFKRVTPEGVFFIENGERQKTQSNKELQQKAQICFAKANGNEVSPSSSHPILTQIQQGDWMSAFIAAAKLHPSTISSLLREIAQMDSSVLRVEGSGNIQLKKFVISLMKRLDPNDSFWAELNSNPSLSFLSENAKDIKLPPLKNTFSSEEENQNCLNELLDHFIKTELTRLVIEGFDFTSSTLVEEIFETYCEKYREDTDSLICRFSRLKGDVTERCAQCIFEGEIHTDSNKWYQRVIKSLSPSDQWYVLFFRDDLKATELLEEKFLKQENLDPFFDGLEDRILFEPRMIDDKISQLARRIDWSDISSLEKVKSNLRLLAQYNQFLARVLVYIKFRTCFISDHLFLALNKGILAFNSQPTPKEVLTLILEIVETAETHFSKNKFLGNAFQENDQCNRFYDVMENCYRILAYDSPEIFSLVKTPFVAAKILKSTLNLKERLTRDHLNEAILHTEELSDSIKIKLQNALLEFQHSLDFLRSIYVICFMVKRDGKMREAIINIIERLPPIKPKNRTIRKSWFIFQGLMSEFGAAHEVAIDTIKDFKFEEKEIEKEIEELRLAFSKKLLDPFMSQMNLTDSEKATLQEQYLRNPQAFNQNNFFHYLGIAAQFSNPTGISALRFFTHQLLQAEIKADVLILNGRYKYLESLGIPIRLINRWKTARKYSLKEIVENIGIINPEERLQGIYQETLKKLQGALGLSSGAFTIKFPHSVEEVETLLHQQWLTSKIRETFAEKISEFQKILSLFANTLMAMHHKKTVNQQSVQFMIRFFSDHASALKNFLPPTYLEVIPLFKILMRSLEEINQAKKSTIPEGYVEITADPTLFMVRGLHPTLTCQRPTEPTSNNESGELVNPMIYGQFMLANLTIFQGGEQRVLGRMILELGFEKRAKRDRISLRGDNLYSTELRFGEWLQEAVRLDGEKLEIYRREIYLPDGKHHHSEAFPQIDLEDIFPDREIRVYRDEDGG